MPIWDFKFDAPQGHNFFQIDQPNLSIEIDPSNPNDEWFLFEHVELTPIK